MTEEITPEQISAYRQQRVKQCGEKLATLLQEYNCDLVAIPQVVEGKIIAVIQLVSKD